MIIYLFVIYSHLTLWYDVSFRNIYTTYKFTYRSTSLISTSMCVINNVHAGGYLPYVTGGRTVIHLHNLKGPLYDNTIDTALS